MCRETVDDVRVTQWGGEWSTSSCPVSAKVEVGQRMLSGTAGEDPVLRMLRTLSAQVGP